MIMTSFLKNRKSVRDFRRRKASEETLEQIRLHLDILEKEEGNGDIKFKLYENGENLFDSLKGIGGYAGVMIESPHYISLGFEKEEKNTIIYGAYFMEKLITKLNGLGLGCCWISIDKVSEEDKNNILGEKGEKIDYLLAIGYARPKNPFINEPTSERIGVNELVFDKKIGDPVSAQELEDRGLEDLFYYVRFAPSTRNVQPWRFVLDDSKVSLLLKTQEGEKIDFIDAGVIMYYFEELAKAIGVSSKWELAGDNPEIMDPNYEYIGSISL